MAVTVRTPVAATRTAHARHGVVEPADLTASEIGRWLELRDGDAKLDSPYFHPAFTAAVAATRSGVRVVIGQDAGGEPEWFLPVQLEGRACRPAGFPAADFQGPICAPGSGLDIRTALRSCGASSYRFDHMREGAPGLQPWVFAGQRSPYMDVSGGLDGYLSRIARSGKDHMSEARRLGRKAEREHGLLRFVADCADGALLDAVIALKRRQYAATGVRDYFAAPEHVGLLHRLLGERGDDFSGMLSAIYAGPHLLAAHFGLRAGPVLHWWFPVYDPRFARLGPGWLLLRAVVDAAPRLGLERIDLGRGVDDYKRRAMTGHQIVQEGAVILNPVRRRTASAQRRLSVAVRTSRMAPALRAGIRRARRFTR